MTDQVREVLDRELKDGSLGAHWRKLGYEATWSDGVRAYEVRKAGAPDSEPEVVLRKVQDVDAWVRGMAGPWMPNRPVLPRDWRTYSFSALLKSVETGKGLVALDGEHRVLPGIDITMASGPAGSCICVLHLSPTKYTLGAGGAVCLSEDIFLRAVGVGLPRLEVMQTLINHAVDMGFLELGPAGEEKV